MQADRLDAQSFGLPTRGSDIYEPSNKITREEEDGRQQYLAYLAQRQRQSKSWPGYRGWVLRAG